MHEARACTPARPRSLVQRWGDASSLVLRLRWHQLVIDLVGYNELVRALKKAREVRTQLLDICKQQRLQHLAHPRACIDIET